MTPRSSASFVLAILASTAATHCAGGDGSGAADVAESSLATLDGGSSLPCSRARIGQRLQGALASLDTDADFSFYLERKDGGAPFVYHRGNSSLTTEYESASTSKWVTAAVILWVVDQGKMRLTDHPQDHLSDWPLATHPQLKDITLSHLLSFTSGLTEEAFCQKLPEFDFWQCVDNIGTINRGNTSAPGAVFHYANTHLQVAGAMAVRASGLASWEALFAQFKLQTRLFSHSRYNLPSAQNPRLAGGMTWTGNDYVEFIRAFRDATFYSSSSAVDTATTDHLADASIGSSPVQAALHEDWHYGHGLWIECHRSTFDPSVCVPTKMISSPGAYGAYPFLSFENSYLGIVARQGELGTFENGYTVFDSVRATATEWAKCANP